MRGWGKCHEIRLYREIRRGLPRNLDYVLGAKTKAQKVFKAMSNMT